jgi:hypothetical protein
MLRSAQHDIYLFLSSVRERNDVGLQSHRKKNEIDSPAARNDIKKWTTFSKDGAFSREGMPLRTIIGISRSPLRGSLEMTGIIAEPFPRLSLRRTE